MPQTLIIYKQTISSVVRRNTQMIYFILAGSEPMQQSIRLFDGTEPTYTTEDFLNAIKVSLLMTAGPEQADSPYNESWILKHRYVTEGPNRPGTTMVLTFNARKQEEMASVLRRILKDIR